MEVCTDEGRRSLARNELDLNLLPADGRWHDVPLEFEVKGLTKLEFRTYFGGKSDLDLDVVLVSFADARVMGRFLPAADLWRQCGDLARDKEVEGGLAVEAKAGYTPSLYLMHGPQETCAPGAYRARFKLALTELAPAQAPVVELAAATDLGRRPLARRRVSAGDLARDYREVVLDFTVKRRCEVGLRVRYLGGASLRLAGVTLSSRR